MSEIRPEAADALWRYCGLYPFQIQGLRDPSGASPQLRRALREGGLLDDQGALTPAGRFALGRAEAILEGRFVPPPPLAEAAYRPGIGRRMGLPGVEAKLLLYVARFPGTAVRFLRREFGNRALARLRERGLITSDLPFEAWSAPVEPTGEGLRIILEAKDGKVLDRPQNGLPHRPVR